MQNTTIQTIIQYLESVAPLPLQESYDNCGLLTGNRHAICTGVLCTLDVTQAVLQEAVQKGANLIVAHHPLIFKPIRGITQDYEIGRLLTFALKHDLAIYALHTNLDNIWYGVNYALATRLGFAGAKPAILAPLSGQIAKLYTYVPAAAIAAVADALFAAGAGHIGQYSECSFQSPGTGSFRPLAGSNPFIGQPGGNREQVAEIKLEVVFPIWLKNNMVKALKLAHPYEEVAYEIMLTANEHQETGAGMVIALQEPLTEAHLLTLIQEKLNLPVVRHTAITGRTIRRVAFCGGAGAMLIKNAIAAGADAYLTADLKYHDFFEPEHKLLLADIGHYESEIAAVSHVSHILQQNFPTFAVLQTAVYTNPVHYKTA